jgi:hypothetical protein
VILGSFGAKMLFLGNLGPKWGMGKFGIKLGLGFGLIWIGMSK